MKNIIKFFIGKNLIIRSCDKLDRSIFLENIIFIIIKLYNVFIYYFLDYNRFNLDLFRSLFIIKCCL